MAHQRALRQRPQPRGGTGGRGDCARDELALYPGVKVQVFQLRRQQVSTVPPPGAQTPCGGTWRVPDPPSGRLGLNRGGFWEMPADCFTTSASVYLDLGGRWAHGGDTAVLDPASRSPRDTDTCCLQCHPPRLHQKRLITVTKTLAAAVGHWERLLLTPQRPGSGRWGEAQPWALGAGPVGCKRLGNTPPLVGAS